MCATCGCRKKADKKQDAAVTKGLNPKQKATFKKKDAEMDKKNLSKSKDAAADKALAKKIKKK